MNLKKYIKVLSERMLKRYLMHGFQKWNMKKKECRKLLIHNFHKKLSNNILANKYYSNKRRNFYPHFNIILIYLFTIKLRQKLKFKI